MSHWQKNNIRLNCAYLLLALHSYLQCECCDASGHNSHRLLSFYVNKYVYVFTYIHTHIYIVVQWFSGSWFENNPSDLNI